MDALAGIISGNTVPQEGLRLQLLTV